MLLQFLIYLTIFLIGYGIILSLNWPLWTIFILALIIVVIVVGNFFYTVYGTTNMKRVEKYLVKNQKDPLFRFTYLQAKGSKEEQISALEEVIRKYKKSYLQNYYQACREELLGNYDKAMDYANQVSKEPFQSYLKALLYAKMDKLEEAEKLIPSILKEFMREEILAIIAKKKNDEEQFEIHKRKAIESCKGINRYILIHSFEKM